MWRSSLWSISWLCHQMFYPYVTISAAQARESDDLRHAMSPFSLFLSSFFFGHAKNLGMCESTKLCILQKQGKEGAQHGDIIGLHTLLRRMQSRNCDTAYIHTAAIFLASHSSSNVWPPCFNILTNCSHICHQWAAEKELRNVQDKTTYLVTVSFH